MRVTFDLPILPPEDYKSWGIERGDFISDLATIARLIVLKRHLQFKDALHVQISPDDEGILEQGVKDAFQAFDHAFDAAGRALEDEIHRQKAVRRNERNRGDRVLKAVKARIQEQTTHRRQ